MAASAGQVVCLEIDDFDPEHHTGWSVMVTGTASVVNAPEELARARQLPLQPWVGHGEAYVRIEATIVSGRRIAARHYGASLHQQDRPTITERPAAPYGCSASAVSCGWPDRGAAWNDHQARSIRGVDQPRQRSTVFLLDDHEIVRRGVRDLIESEPDLEVIGEAGSVEEALRRVEASQPNVAVLDVQLGDGSDGDRGVP